MIREHWESEVRSFVRLRSLLGAWTPQDPNWKFSKCVRCGSEGSQGFDAHISSCAACKPYIEKVTGERE